MTTFIAILVVNQMASFGPPESRSWLSTVTKRIFKCWDRFGVCICIKGQIIIQKMFSDLELFGQNCTFDQLVM